jgi:hypothetical protein
LPSGENTNWILLRLETEDWKKKNHLVESIKGIRLPVYVRHGRKCIKLYVQGSPIIDQYGTECMYISFDDEDLPFVKKIIKSKSKNYVDVINDLKHYMRQQRLDILTQEDDD